MNRIKENQPFVAASLARYIEGEEKEHPLPPKQFKVKLPSVTGSLCMNDPWMKTLPKESGAIKVDWN
jgi:hypothetical protein